MIYVELQNNVVRVPAIDFGDFTPVGAGGCSFVNLGELPTPNVGDIWNGSSFESPPAPESVRLISKHDFFVRFPSLTQKYIAAPFEFVGNGLTQAQAEQIAAMAFSASVSDEIYLDLPETQGGINWLVSEGILSQNDADNILA